MLRGKKFFLQTLYKHKKIEGLKMRVGAIGNSYYSMNNKTNNTDTLLLFNTFFQKRLFLNHLSFLPSDVRISNPPNRPGLPFQVMLILT